MKKETVKLREFTLDDYEELVDMFYEFYKETSIKTIYPKYFYYKDVISWIAKNKKIVLAVKGNMIIGFNTFYYTENNGLTEPYIFGEYCYVKPEYRNSRAAYLLYNNCVQYAAEHHLPMTAMGRIENGGDSIIKKHFKAMPTYITFERNQ